MTAQNKLVGVAMAAAIACVLVPRSAAADTVTIPNWDFSVGSGGFSSDYANPGLTSRIRSLPPDHGLLWPEGTYAVGTDPSLYHCLWPSFGDHTTGDGGMLIVNGSPYAGAIVWSASVDVVQYTRYDFSAWVASVYPDNPARLGFYVNGVPLGEPYALVAATGLWQQFNALWDSDTATTALLSLVDLNTERHGNDFGVDDLRFAVPEPVPEPASLLLFGSGIVGLARIVKGRNKRKAADAGLL